MDAFEYHMSSIKYTDNKSYAFGHARAMCWLVDNRKKKLPFKHYTDYVESYGVSTVNKAVYEQYLEQEYAF